MSQKRKHGETLESSSSDPKSFKKHRKFNNPGSDHHRQAKQHKKRPHVSDDIDKSSNINTLKSRIRDLKRLLAHVDNVGDHKMSAGKRIERERELEACEHELAEKVELNREAEHRKKMIGKYHQVRFFDRQKATRILKRLKKDLLNADDDSTRKLLEQRIHNAEVDANYPTFYPLMKAYSSLYPKSKNDRNTEVEADDSDAKEKNSEFKDGPKGDIEMWRAVEKAMQDNTLNALRYSNEGMPAAPVKQAKKKNKEKEKEAVKKVPPKTSYNGAEPANRRERRALERERAEESDGGFFE